MFSQTYYLLRSRSDGNYLVARPKPERTYLLLFSEYADALSYVNTHSPDLSDRFAVEPITGIQITATLKRWGYQGVGMVQDPLLPRVEFLAQAT